MCIERLSALADPVALPRLHRVSVLPQQPGGQHVLKVEFISCPSSPPCQIVAWSKATVSCRVRKIHRRLTDLTRALIAGDGCCRVICAHSLFTFSCS